MLCWIAILGGLLIMMGQHSRSEALFYYFRLEDQVPETHLLRLTDDNHVTFKLNYTGIESERIWRTSIFTMLLTCSTMLRGKKNICLPTHNGSLRAGLWDFLGAARQGAGP
jgi:hypothetical protein